MITFYGVGFGSVTPNIPAGQIVTQSNTLGGSVQVLFGATQATVTYAGLVANALGLYQINAVVPNITGGDLIPLTFTVAGTPERGLVLARARELVGFARSQGYRRDELIAL